MFQIGGANCSICGSPGTNKSTCPCNPDIVKPNYEKHPNWIKVCPEKKKSVALVVKKPVAPVVVKKAPPKKALVVKKKLTYISPKAPKKVLVDNVPMTSAVNAILHHIHYDLADLDKANVTYIIDLMNKVLNDRLKYNSVKNVVELQNNVRNNISGELAKYAVGEATKHVTRIIQKQKPTKIMPELLISPDFFYDSLSQIVDVEPVDEDDLPMRQKTSIYLAGVIEYLIGEILEVAGNKTLDLYREDEREETEDEKIPIFLSDIKKGIAGDPELSLL